MQTTATLTGINMTPAPSGECAARFSADGAPRITVWLGADTAKALDGHLATARTAGQNLVFSLTGALGAPVTSGVNPETGVAYPPEQTLRALPGESAAQVKFLKRVQRAPAAVALDGLEDVAG